jgi:hypothetical protein
MLDGPVDLMVLTFAGDSFRGPIVQIIRDFVDDETIRIIDVLFVRKRAAGKAEVLEFTDLDHVDRTAWTPLVSTIEGQLSETDARQIAGLLANQSAAVVLLVEDVWAKKFRERIREAQAELLLLQRVPHTLLDSTLTAVPVPMDLADPETNEPGSESDEPASVAH